MFGALVQGMQSLINWLYELTIVGGIPNYGLAIIMLTILIKLLLHPLTRIQMRSMAQMSQLQPELRAIQEKYGKDKQMQQQKMMELYRERKVNPMSGCLLLLLQLPILIALYRALWDFPFVNPAHASFLWVGNLSERDPLFILPVLAAVTTYVQAKMSMALSAGGGNPTQESMQKMMLTAMPLFIGWISATLPAGLSVYWVTFNLVGIVQQGIINKQLLADRAAAAQAKSSGNEKRAVAAEGEVAGVAPSGKSAAVKKQVRESSAKGKGVKPGKEEVAQGESSRRKRKKRGRGNRGSS